MTLRTPTCAVLARGGGDPPEPASRSAPARWYFAGTPAFGLGSLGR